MWTSGCRLWQRVSFWGAKENFPWIGYWLRSKQRALTAVGISTTCLRQSPNVLIYFLPHPPVPSAERSRILEDDSSLLRLRKNSQFFVQVIALIPLHLPHAWVAESMDVPSSWDALRKQVTRFGLLLDPSPSPRFAEKLTDIWISVWIAVYTILIHFLLELSWTSAGSDGCMSLFHESI